MESKIVNLIGLKTRPVVIEWTDDAPEDAVQFRPGRWGCVMGLMAQVAMQGRTALFARDTFGCHGGGIGLGFGDQSLNFPGGAEGFCRFLADGNGTSEVGQEIGRTMKSAGLARMADDFLLGERYVKDLDCAKRFLGSLPILDVPAKYVVAKPLVDVVPQDDNVKSVTFFVEPDALSALVVLANHTHPERENVAIPWAAACQVMGILAYRESESNHQRSLVGLTDISARRTVRGSLGKDVMTFTAPWSVFQAMEKQAEGSFLERETWKTLTRVG